MTRQQHCTVLFFVFKSETRIKTPKRSDLSDEDFLKWLISIGGTPPELLANPEVLKLFLPALKADLHVVENYRWADSCLLLNLLLTFLKPSVDVVSDGSCWPLCRCNKASSPLFSCPVTCFDGKDDIPHDLQGQCSNRPRRGCTLLLWLLHWLKCKLLLCASPFFVLPSAEQCLRNPNNQSPSTELWLQYLAVCSSECES